MELPVDFRLIRAAYSTAKRLPQAAQLMTLARQAAEGDPDAAEYLRQHGVRDALNVVGPELGDQLVGVWQNTRATVDHLMGERDRDVVDAEYTEIHPWTHYQRWLAAQEWGLWVILGPKGRGKTTLARRLAEVWAQRTGYRIEGVNIYPEDRDDDLVPISLNTLKKRLQVLRSYLAAYGDPDELDDEPTSAADEAALIVENALGLSPATVAELREKARQERQAAAADALEGAFRAMQGRIIIVDETSLEVGAHGSDAGRQILRRFAAQLRHLGSHLILIGQIARMLPLESFVAESIFLQCPNGDEAELDRPEALIQSLWTNAARTFRELRGSPYKAAFPDRRSWTHVECRGRYVGPMPFRLPGSDRDEPIQVDGELVE